MPRRPTICLIAILILIFTCLLVHAQEPPELPPLPPDIGGPGANQQPPPTAPPAVQPGPAAGPIPPVTIVPTPAPQPGGEQPNRRDEPRNGNQKSPRTGSSGTSRTTGSATTPSGTTGSSLSSGKNTKTTTRPAYTPPPVEIAPFVPSGPGRDWPVYKGDTAHTGFTEERLNFPLKLAWKLVGPMTVDEIGKQNPSSPVVEKGVVYFCAGRRLYAVNADTGSLRWYYPTEALSSSIKTTPVVGENLVYFGASDGRIYAVTKDKGTLYWSFVTKGIVNSSPVLSDGILYVGSGDDHLYALDAETGEAIWPGGFRVRDDVNSSPAVADGMVYFMSNDMVLYAANASPSTEKPRWAVQVGGISRNISPVVAENTVFVAAGNYLQAYQAKSGRLRWSLQMPNTVTTTPAYANGVLYFGCADGKFYAATAAGKIKWTTPANIGAKSYSSPIVAGDSVIIAANRGTLVALNAETGVMRWSYTILPSSLETGVKSDYVNIIAAPAVSDGTLYVLADDGALYAFRYEAPDNTPPNVLKFTPPQNTPLPGAPPLQIAAVFTDPGSGIRPDAISLALDGQAVEFTMIPERGIIYYNTPVTQPVVPLEDGLHTVTLTLTDWAGNRTEKSWIFSVDNRVRRAVTTTGTTGGGGATGPANP